MYFNPIVGYGNKDGKKYFLVPTSSCKYYNIEQLRRDVIFESEQLKLQAERDKKEIMEKYPNPEHLTSAELFDKALKGEI